MQSPGLVISDVHTKYHLLYRALLQKRPVILRSLLNFENAIAGFTAFTVEIRYIYINIYIYIYIHIYIYI